MEAGEARHPESAARRVSFIELLGRFFERISLSITIFVCANTT
jgi:hypothetical protein